MEINWTIIILGIIVSFTISLIVNGIKEIIISKNTNKILESLNPGDLEIIERMNKKWKKEIKISMKQEI